MLYRILKIFLLLHRRPVWILAIALISALVCVRPIQQLEIRKSFTDLLPDDFRSVKVWKQSGEKFGGLGNLTLVFRSDDPDICSRAIDFLTENLSDHPDVNFLEWKTEADFYRAHQLLYVKLDDLKDIERRVQSGFWVTRAKRNPLILDLLEDNERESLVKATSFEDLEQKYFGQLKEHLGNSDGKIRILRIYPDFEITDIERGRALLRDVEKVVASLPQALGTKAPETFYTGDLWKNVNQEGRLYSGLIDSTKKALALAALLLLLSFIRIPFGAILAGIPIALALIWTLAITRLCLGHLSLVTAPLGLLLAGLGLDGAIKLLDRYREERRKHFSAPLAFETLVLETGPAVLTSMSVLGAVFLTLMLTRFKGFAEFGLMAGIGMVALIIAVMIVFPALLIAIEPLGLLPAFGRRLYNHDRWQAHPYRHWKLHLVVTGFLSFLLLLMGPQNHMEYRFDKLGFRHADKTADSLLQVAGETNTEPAFFLTSTLAESRALADSLRRRKESDTLSPTLGEITTLEDLLPAAQTEKLAIISRLRHTITPSVIEQAPEPLRTSLRKLEKSWPTRILTVSDLPDNYRRKFLGRDSASGYFTFAFPAVDSRLGWNAIAFAEDLRGIPLAQGEATPSGGAVIYADLLGLVAPDSLRILFAALLTMVVLVFIDVRSLRGTVVLTVPVLLSVLWTLGTLKWLGIRYNPYNLVAFPGIVAFTLGGSLLIYHRYLEEGRGSIGFVIRRCGETLALSTLVGLATFATLPYSEHRAASTLGVAAIVGLIFSLAAPLLFMPGFMGWLESRQPTSSASEKPAPTPDSKIPLP